MSLLGFSSWFSVLFTSLLITGCTQDDDIHLPILLPETDVISDSSEQGNEYIAVFGDIQEYTKNDVLIDYYNKSNNWLDSSFFKPNNLKAVIEVGDITWQNRDFQWQLFFNSTQRFAEKVPYYVCTGNHDYDWITGNKIANRNSTLINKYANFFSTRSTIVDFYEGQSLENYVAKVSICNDDLYLLVLEFGPREEVVNWAISFVQSHPDNRFLLLTHEWLTRGGERISSKSTAEAQFKGYSSFSTPEQVWQRLVYPNDNIWCVLCGHNGFCKMLCSENQAGRNVAQILFNLQYQDNGGNGLIQIWEFDSEESTVSIRIYDTLHNEWYDSEETSFSIQY